MRDYIAAGCEWGSYLGGLLRDFNRPKTAIGLRFNKHKAGVQANHFAREMEVELAIGLCAQPPYTSSSFQPSSRMSSTR